MDSFNQLSGEVQLIICGAAMTVVGLVLVGMFHRAQPHRRPWEDDDDGI